MNKVLLTFLLIWSCVFVLPTKIHASSDRTVQMLLHERVEQRLTYFDLYMKVQVKATDPLVYFFPVFGDGEVQILNKSNDPWLNLHQEFGLELQSEGEQAVLASTEKILKLEDLQPYLDSLRTTYSVVVPKQQAETVKKFLSITPSNRVLAIHVADDTPTGSWLPIVKTEGMPFGIQEAMYPFLLTDRVSNRFSLELVVVSTDPYRPTSNTFTSTVYHWGNYVLPVNNTFITNQYLSYVQQPQFDIEGYHGYQINRSNEFEGEVAQFSKQPSSAFTLDEQEKNQQTRITPRIFFNEMMINFSDFSRDIGLILREWGQRVRAFLRNEPSLKKQGWLEYVNAHGYFTVLYPGKELVACYQHPEQDLILWELPFSCEGEFFNTFPLIQIGDIATGDMQLPYPQLSNEEIKVAHKSAQRTVYSLQDSDPLIASRGTIIQYEIPTKKEGISVMATLLSDKPEHEWLLLKMLSTLNLE